MSTMAPTIDRDPAPSAAAEGADGLLVTERRLVRRLFIYWDRIRRGRPMPCMSDINPNQLPSDWASCFIINATAWPDGADAVSHLGRNLLIDAGLHLAVDEAARLPENTLFGQAVTQLPDVVATGIPFLGEGGFRHANGSQVIFRSILLPFGTRPPRVDDILGAVLGRRI